MITKITKEQEDRIPEYIDKWVKIASEPMNKEKAIRAVKDLYSDMKEEEPIVIIGQSPISCYFMYLMISLMLGDKKLEDSQLRSQLSSQLHSQLYSQQQFNNWYVSYWWLDWMGLYDYAKYIGVEFDNKAYNIFLNYLSEVHFIIPFKGIAFISEKPKIYWKEKKLHNEKGMAVEYEDKWGIYSLEGISFDKKLWKAITSKKITSKDVMKIENTEQRAVAVKIIGAEKIIKELGGKVIDEKQFSYGKDYLIELEGFKDGLGASYKFLKGYDPAENDYVYVRTTPNAKTVIDAHNFCYRLQLFGKNYEPEQRT